MEEVHAEAERINRRLRDGELETYRPLERQHSHEEILPYYRTADFCLVTSLARWDEPGGEGIRGIAPGSGRGPYPEPLRGRQPRTSAMPWW